MHYIAALIGLIGLAVSVSALPLSDEWEEASSGAHDLIWDEARSEAKAGARPTGTCSQYDASTGPAWVQTFGSGGCNIPVGVMVLPMTSKDQLLTLVRFTDQATSIPIGRSYHGSRWESIHSNTILTPWRGLESHKYKVTIPNDGHAYGLLGKFMSSDTNNARAYPKPSAKVSAARFLMQATFGPTRNDVNRFSTPAQWIQSQMSMPASYVRARWRKRVNPRAISDGGLRAGAEVGACESGSYWNKYSFNKRDLFQQIKVRGIGRGAVALSVDGVERTEISAADKGDMTAGQTVHICAVKEWLGGEVTVDPGNACSDDESNRISFANPSIRLTRGMDSSRTLWVTPSSGSLKTVANDADSVVLTRFNNSRCDISARGGTNFLVFDGINYRLDARLRLQENTLERPANMRPANAGATCPKVRETFTNERTCRRCKECSAASFSSASIRLDEATIRKWYTKSNKYVYYVDGLDVHSNGVASPCEGVSRWVPVTGAICSQTSLRADTKETLVTTIRASQDRNSIMRDVNVREASNGAGCGAPRGTVVRVDGRCWQHVHPNHRDVFDLSLWAEENEYDRVHEANPITQVAIDGKAGLRWDNMDEFNRVVLHRVRFNAGIARLGRLGDRVDFKDLPAMAQTEEMAQLVGARGASTDEYFLACGSAGEGANDPSLGHHYNMILGSHKGDDELRDKHLAWNGKRMSWTMNSLYAPDQLRQRMAWSLSQILIIADVDTDNKLMNEYWLHFHDIFVQHAFGSFGDILKEVAYNPAMSDYLTYKNNKANAEYAGSSTYPDENFSREITQLFSIGLYKLNKDGTKVLSENGEYVPTFGTDNIMSMARAWTGFHSRYGTGFRENLESFKGFTSNNYIDPLEINPAQRDIFPKHDLNGDYIGDGYALCSDIPDRAFLLKGATFKFKGFDANVEYDPYIKLSTSSQLYRKLCRERNGKCSFPREVVLGQAVPCDGQECKVDEASMVELTHGGIQAYYTWIRPPCVSFSFYEGREAATKQGQGQQAICADPNNVAGGSVCCSTENGNEKMQCVSEYFKEAVKWQTNVDRCNATINPQTGERLHQCKNTNTGLLAWPLCKYSNAEFLWTTASCSPKVLVNTRGFVNIVHDTQTATAAKHFQSVNEVNFYVPWDRESYPTTQAAGCGDFCVAQAGGSCLCSATTSERAVFSATSMPSSSADVLDQLKVGATRLELFDEIKKFTVCETRACSIAGVTVYLKTESSTPERIIDANTVFLVQKHGISQYRRNMVSIVSVGDHSFRNPVQFMPTHRPVSLPSFLQGATDETQALLDHLLYHDNTAPFISHLLIQRLVTSNPSPRYVEVVATAFQTGVYDGRTYSGTYGDLGATVAAILLDQEARSEVLDLDPAWGRMHEPILKVLHLLRSMEINTRGRELELYDMDQLIGQMAFSSPTVFSFYLPDYQPTGAVNTAGLYAPEAQLGAAPWVVGFLNGAASLINNGLTNCKNGFGSPQLAGGDRRFNGQHSCNGYTLEGKTHGWLTYRPRATKAAEVVDELAMLLTGRQLGSHTAGILTKIYENSITKLPDVDPKKGVMAPGCYYRTPGGCNSAKRDVVYAPIDFMPDTTSTNVTYRQNEQACLIDRKAELNTYCRRTNIETRFIPDDGLRKVMRLLMAAPEFHATNHHSPSSQARAATPTVTGRGRKIKAVVVLWMNGGADSFNLLVPHSQCRGGRDLYAEYAQQRAPIAQRQGDLLQINSAPGRQPCNRFGLHPTMTHFQKLYKDGDLAFVANAGGLVEPATKADYEAAPRTKEFPNSLFAHNIMQRVAETVDANVPTSPGILGRVSEALESGPQQYKTGLYSLAGNKKFVMGGVNAPKPTTLDRRHGVIRYDEYNEWNSTIGEILGDGHSSTSVFADTHAETLMNALSNTESLGAVLDDVTMSTTFPQTRIGQQFEQVAKVLAGREETEVERATFVVELGGWDHHSNAVELMNMQMAEVNAALEAFSSEAKAQGIWEDVAVITYSEFARTLTTNGAGTDHAWGGNYMLMGGSVKGGQILGQYPPSLAAGSEQDIGRGRFLPTTSWEAIWNGLADWMGVEGSEMDKLLPNKKNFPNSQLFSKNDLFEN